jgi:chemotaxis protein histidine kinase CheA
MIEGVGHWFALAVDEVIGIQPGGARNIEGEIGKPVFISGGAIMGDRQVAMGVDLTPLLRE